MAARPSRSGPSTGSRAARTCWGSCQRSRCRRTPSRAPTCSASAMGSIVAMGTFAALVGWVAGRRDRRRSRGATRAAGAVLRGRRRGRQLLDPLESAGHPSLGRCASMTAPSPSMTRSWWCFRRTVFLTAVAHGQEEGFRFQGYFRSGFGVAGTGDPQEAFRAPNAGAKYRLGNETEAYLETIFGYGLRPKDDSTAFFDTRINVSYVTPTSNTNSFETTTALREAFVVATGVWKAQQDASFWAGQRFFDRHNMNMNDFFYRDLSGFGGGLDDVRLGGGPLRAGVAWLGGSVNELESNGSVPPPGLVPAQQEHLRSPALWAPARRGDPGGGLRPGATGRRHRAVLRRRHRRARQHGLGRVGPPRPAARVRPQQAVRPVRHGGRPRLPGRPHADPGAALHPGRPGELRGRVAVPRRGGPGPRPARPLLSAVRQRCGRSWTMGCRPAIGSPGSRSARDRRTTSAATSRSSSRPASTIPGRPTRSRARS